MKSQINSWPIQGRAHWSWDANTKGIKMCDKGKSSELCKIAWRHLWITLLLKFVRTVAALGVEGVEEDPVGTDATQLLRLRIEDDARCTEGRAVGLAGVFDRQRWQDVNLRSISKKSLIMGFALYTSGPQPGVCVPTREESQ